MGETSETNVLSAAIPLFPLPNVVLFPRAILPLHIFEERYKKMTADVIKGHRQIAMALLKPGWEKDYYGQPALEPIVCVGTILSHERLPDGCYNFLLQGHTRARIVREIDCSCSYRVAELEPLLESPVLEIDLDAARQRLVNLFDQPAYQSLPAAHQISHLLRGPAPTRIITDLIAFNILSEHNLRLKQYLLAEADVRKRVCCVVDALTAMAPSWRHAPVDVSLN